MSAYGYKRTFTHTVIYVRFILSLKVTLNGWPISGEFGGLWQWNSTIARSVFRELGEVEIMLRMKSW